MRRGPIAAAHARAGPSPRGAGAIRACQAKNSATAHRKPGTASPASISDERHVGPANGVRIAEESEASLRAQHLAQALRTHGPPEKECDVVAHGAMVLPWPWRFAHRPADQFAPHVRRQLQQVVGRHRLGGSRYRQLHRQCTWFDCSGTARSLRHTPPAGPWNALTRRFPGSP